MPIKINDQVKTFLPRIAFVIGCMAFSWVASSHYIHTQVIENRRALEAERQRILADYPPPIQVVVASKDLPEGVALDSEHIAPGAVPEKFIQPYAAREPGQVLGLVTVAPVAAGEQILLNKLRKPEEVPTGTLLSTIVPKGKRAVTITVDTITGVGGFVRPGDVVDVLWTIGTPGAGETPQIITMTLFQDVPVMAVGRELPGRVRRARSTGDAGQAAGTEGTESGEEEQAVSQPSEGTHEYTVTLALAPQEISFLLFAREQGRVQLSLRPRNESGSQVAVAPVNMATLLAAMLGVQALQQGPPPKIDRKVELYKGLNRDVVVLSEDQPGAPAH